MIGEAGRTSESTQQISAVTGKRQPSLTLVIAMRPKNCFELPDDIGDELDFSMDDWSSRREAWNDLAGLRCSRQAEIAG